jgi:hypothetical protein
MAKQRKGISKALKKGKVESGFTIDESADDSGFGTPKTKEKSLSQAAKEQNEFNSRYGFSADVNSENYDNSKGEVPEEYAGAVNSWSDYRMVPKMRQEDQSDNVKSSSETPIKSSANYTSPSSSRSDKIYNDGFNIVDILRRKGYEDGTIFDESDRPTLDNPMGKGLDEKTNKMSTKPAGKVDSKQGSALVGATKKTEETTQAAPEKMDAMPTKEAGTVSPTQGQSLVTAVQQNPVAQVTQNAVLETGVKDASSPSQLQQAVQISSEAKKEAQEMESNVDEAISDQATVRMVPYGTLDEEDQPINIQEQVKTVPGDGTTVSSVISTQGQNFRPSYEQTGSTQDVQQGVADMYAKINEGIPKAVVEKLGIQDYYPNAGRDIAVGTFSGSRIGSQTIYSGAGALLPMGLYDARKRALKEAATEKKKQLDKFFDVIETAPQYSKAVNESWNNWLNDNLAKYNFDADKFLSDPNMRKEYAKRLSNAKDITYWATWADGYLKDAEKKENYGTAEGIKIAGEIKMAMMDHMDEIASGEKSLKDFIDIDKAKLYQNIIPQMDLIVKEALDPNRMGKSPINMRTGDVDGKMDPEEFKQQRDQFVIKAKSGTLGKDEYLSGFKKFFTGDYEQVIDGLIESGKFSAEQKDAAMDYFAGQMQEQIEINPQFVDNDALEYARLAEDRRQFNAEFERKKEEGKTPWTVANELMNRTSQSTGKTMQQELLEARKKGYTGDQLKTYMLRKARELGFPNAEWDANLGTVVMKSPASQYEANNYFPVSTTNKEAFIKLVEVKTVNGKKVKTPVSIPIDQFVNDKNAAKKYMFTDGSAVSDDDLTAWKGAYSNNRIAIKPSSYESYYGVAGSQTGQQRPVNSTTIKDYDPRRAVNIRNSTGQAYATIPIEGKPGESRAAALKGTIFVPADINDPTQRRVADGMFGNDAKQFEYTQQGGTSSSSRGSMSSQ